MHTCRSIQVVAYRRMLSFYFLFLQFQRTAHLVPFDYYIIFCRLPLCFPILLIGQMNHYAIKRAILTLHSFLCLVLLVF
ncbi:hypothetical protein CICLE_v10033877mg [Citrus x clementina]|uniref:Uncharacterized protein n=1 Tax=Citrus clementina TaxID=85681 RepID=V4SVY5_CITCL|nr:hypothetical protein CICLE_v10033877mg [Citrus x clementina]